MLSETITLPKSITEAENRFIIELKRQLLRQIKQINELELRIKKLEESDDNSD